MVPFPSFSPPFHTALAFPVLGEDVLITGAGPIGIMAAAVARHAGARYTVIYDANHKQIQNPNRIYPGQVFIIPDGKGD